MLKQRVLSAVVLIPIALALLYLGGWWFTALVLLFGILAAYEAYVMLRRNDHAPLTWWGVLFVAALIVTGMTENDFWFFVVLVAGVLITLTRALFHVTSQPATDWTLTVGVALYLGVLMRHGPLLRNRPDGLWWVIVALVTTWIGDSAAYFVGTAIGRHRLAPRLSPKKSWEGAIAGWVSGALTGLLLVPLVLPLSPLQGLILGLLITLVAVPGDLAESMFKRQCGVKDSGHLIPGHGGAFDRIDSLLFVFPVVYWLALLWG